MGCAKEEPEVSTLKTAVNSPEVKQRINHFMEVLRAGKEASEGVSSRENTTLSIDEMEWGLSSSLNIIYGSDKRQFEKMDRQATVLEVPLTDGVVKAEDVYAAYQAAWAKANEHYNSVSLDTKELAYTVVKYEGTQDNKATLTLTTAVGKPMATPTVLGSWAVNSGDCTLGIFMPGYPGADEVLENNANTNYPLNHPLTQPTWQWGEGWVVGYTGAYKVKRSANDYPNANPTNEFRDYKLYSDVLHDRDPNACIPEEDMDWYAGNLDDIVTSLVVPGFAFMSIDMYVVNNANDYDYHEFKLTQGKPVWRYRLYPYDLSDLLIELELP